MVDPIVSGSGRQSGLLTVREGRCEMICQIEREVRIWLAVRNGGVGAVVGLLARHPSGARARDKVLEAHNGLVRVLG